MKMKSCRILDLIRVLERRLAKSPVKVREIGIRPGEKLHEVLVSGYESEHTYHYNDHYFVILPPLPNRGCWNVMAICRGWSSTNTTPAPF